MRLGLWKLARETLGMAVACAVGLTVAGMISAGTGAVANAADPSTPWTVTVEPASQTLYPGTKVTMAYSVKNTTSGLQRLHGMATGLRTKPADNACLQWFRVASNSSPADVDVSPGGVVTGSLELAFDDPPVDQNACQNIAIDVVVTAS